MVESALVETLSHCQRHVICKSGLKALMIVIMRQMQGERGMGGPSLVVAPLSVLSSWMKEFQRWAPHLRVVRIHSNGIEDKKRIRREVSAPVRTPDSDLNALLCLAPLPARPLTSGLCTSGNNTYTAHFGLSYSRDILHTCCSVHCFKIRMLGVNIFAITRLSAAFHLISMHSQILLSTASQPALWLQRSDAGLRIAYSGAGKSFQL